MWPGPPPHGLEDLHVAAGDKWKVGVDTPMALRDAVSFCRRRATAGT
jgi:hypothetical protein